MWEGKEGATKGTNRKNRMIGPFFVEPGVNSLLCICQDP